MKYGFAMMAMVCWGLQGADESRALAVFSPESINLTLESGEHATRSLQISNTGLSDLTVSLLIFDRASRRDLPTRINPGNTGVNNHGVEIENTPVRVQVGEFNILPGCPDRLTCFTLDPTTGYLYAQQNYGFSFYRYQWDTNSWVQLADCPLDSRNNGGAVYLEGKIYQSYTGNATLMVYDISANSWSVAATIEQTGNITTDGQKIYLSGDFTLFSFDPESGDVTSLASPTRSDDNRWGGLEFYNGFLYHHYGDGLTLFDRYNIATDTWQVLPDTPGESVLGSAIGLDVYYTLGGYGGNNLYSYNLLTNQWMPTVPLPFFVNDAGLAFFGQSLYVIEGETGYGFAEYSLYPKWVRTYKHRGLIPPAENLTIDLYFNSWNLAAGDYLAEIRVETNDPVHPEAVIPITLSVTDAPRLQATPTSLDFGSVLVGAETTAQFQVRNIGSIPLNVTAITSDNPDYTANHDTLTLDSGQVEQVTVTFTPSHTGVSSGQIEVLSNGGSFVINVTGIGDPPPEIVVNPTSFSSALISNQVEHQTLTIQNNGTGDLVFTLVETLSWVAANPTSGTVAPGASTDVDITISGSNFIEGVYSGDLTVNSNDPQNSSVVIPIELEVTGIPNLVASPSSIFFTSTPIGLTTQWPIRISNSGTAELEVTSITSNHASFQTPLDHMTVQPGGTQSFLVTYAPTMTGTEIGAISIVSNGGNRDVTVRGTGIEPAEISVSSDPINVTVGYGHVETRNLPIGNLGTSTLSASFHDGASEQDLDPGHVNLSGKKIYYDGNLGGWPQMVAELASRGATLIKFDHPIQSLENADLVWIVDVALPSWTSTELNLMEDWVARGGGLLLEGSSQYIRFNQIMPNSANVSFISPLGLINDITNNITPHPITNSISSLGHPIARGRINFSPPARRIVDYSLESGRYGYTEGVVSQSGLGRIVGLSNSFLSQDIEDNILFGNRIFDWLSGKNNISFSSSVLSLLPGSSSVDISFHADGLEPGSYNQSVVIRSNDPVSPIITIPVILEVVDSARAQVFPNSLEFGVAPVGGQLFRVGEVGNAGNLPLVVTDVLSSSSVFSATPSAFSLNPGETMELVIRFSPSSEILFNGDLTLVSNDTDVEISCTGLGAEAVDPVISPLSISESINAGEQVPLKLTITNPGGSLLSVHLDTSEPVARMAHRLSPPIGVGPWGKNQPEDQGDNRSLLLADLSGYRIGVSGDFSNWQTLFTDLEARGASITQTPRPITDFTVYDLLWVNETSSYWGGIELTSMHDWLFNGGRLLVENPNINFGHILPSGQGITPLTSLSIIDDITDNIFPHPVTEGILQLDLRPAMGRMLVDPPAKALLAYSQYSGRYGTIMGAVSHWGSGRILNLAGPILNKTTGDNQKFGNQVIDWMAQPRPSWIVLDPSQAAIPADESQDIDLILDATDLTGGVYEAAISVYNTNLPNEEHVIPVTITVAGQPVASLTLESLDFGRQFVGVAQTLHLSVSNTGTDIVTVAEVSVDNPEISLAPVSFDLMPGQAQAVSVEFLPTSPQTLNAMISVISNGGNFQIPVSGLADYTPIMVASPDTLTVTAVGGRLNTATLQVNNTGDGVLYFKLNRGRALVIGDGDTEHDVVQLLIESGLESVEVVDDSDFEGGDPALDDFELVVLLDGVNSGDDMPASGQTALVDFVQNGGGLILFEWITYEISRGRYLTLEPLTRLVRDGAQSGVFQYSKISKHPVTLGVNHHFSVETGSNVGGASGGMTLVSSGETGPAVVVSEIGDGRVVQFASAGNWGGLHPLGEPNMAKLFRNSINWAAGLWFYPKPHLLEIPGHSSLDVTLIFDALNEGIGSRSSSFKIMGNDPLLPESTVLVHMQVTCLLQDTLFPLLGDWPVSSTISDLSLAIENLCD